MAHKDKTPASDTKRGHSAKLMVIQPAVAARWLEKNAHNRTIVKAHYARIKRLFESGKFSPPGKKKVTGATLKFDKNGDLLDGQHRLMACAETGMPFETWVIFGLEPEIFPLIDQGAARTNAHILGIDDPDNNREGFKNARTVAATITAMRGIEEGVQSGTMPKTIGWTLKERVEAMDAHEFAHKHAALIDEAVQSVRGPEARRILRPPGTFAALYFLLASRNHSRAREFFNLLAAGTGLMATSPIYRLREALIDSIGDKSRTAPWKSAITIKAWNAWLSKKPMRQLRFGTGEKFPKPRARG